MRTLTDHIVEGDSANHQISVTVMDMPGSGGASHVYAIETDPDVHRVGRPRSDSGETHGAGSCLVQFQNGPIKESGVNGVTHEALLAVVMDRLRSFQAGPFASGENALALSHCEEALKQLQKRTRARIARGVEGTSAV